MGRPKATAPDAPKVMNPVAHMEPFFFAMEMGWLLVLSGFVWQTQQGARPRLERRPRRE